MDSFEPNLDYDVVIVGAGISGLNLAYRLRENHPGLSFCILESRHELGGTWSLFNYPGRLENTRLLLKFRFADFGTPGIRSDSDLFTFGFAWRPWQGKEAIVSGSRILEYLKESAVEAGLDKMIKYNHRVQHMSWDTPSATWTLNVGVDAATATAKGIATAITTRFVMLGTGYYDMQEPLQSQIPGLDNFRGQVIHPQFWPADADYKDKQVVIIGSGATAITLLPSMTQDASHVIMLQRSPTYIVSLAQSGAFERAVRACMPAAAAHRLIRLKWMATSLLLVRICRWLPSASKATILRQTKAQLPDGMPLDPDFNPMYNPWEQRMCISPDGDFYQSLRHGSATVKTGIIETVTASSIRLTSGEELHPDIIVTATGLKLQIAGGIGLTVDGKLYDACGSFMWRTAMLQGLPNVAFMLGYVDASWTLGTEVTAQLVCRLLKQMKSRRCTVVMPHLSDDAMQTMEETPLLNLRSTYVNQGNHSLPKCGDHSPWRSRTNYLQDMMGATWGDIDDGLIWS